ncbi:hypothetical protein BLNAU_16671 [Blattamonas nauphoetae]|uniref:Uncharacterized protein n=1 Tax=Blattamonas nauphoetae TaxID=2049346 RepID=A0ABQ9XDN4_9EUKA|nr:hypothetical protein BLNAU_16671 [Blattamonas nauphoetae]
MNQKKTDLRVDLRLEMCELSTGLMRLEDTNSTLQSVVNADLDDSGVVMSDSSLRIESSTFHDNTANDEVEKEMT